MNLLWPVLFVILMCCLVPFLWTFAPYFPTRRKDLAKISEVVQPEPGQIFYELGCGDATVSLYLAKKHPEVQFVGYEIFLPVYLIAKLRSVFYTGKNLKIYYRNVFWQDLSGANWVYTFGMKDGLILKLRDKLLRELKPGAKLVSYIFKVKDWPGAEVIHQAEDKAKVYVYTK